MTRFPDSVFPRRGRLAAALAAVGLSFAASVSAQVLVRVSSASLAHQGPNVQGSNAAVENGVVSTFVGNGGSASAGPSGSGVTRGEALAFQPGGNGTTTFSSGTTTRADLATARHTGAVLNTPFDNFGSPSGASISRLEDVVYFVNATALDVEVPISWIIDGLVTPPGAPFVGGFSIVAVARIMPGPTASPRLRGTSGTTNDVVFDYRRDNGRRYFGTNGVPLSPGVGPTWTITPTTDHGARMESALTLPPGVSSVRMANSLDINCGGGTSCDYSLGGAQFALGALPAGVTMASASGAFLGAPRPTPVPSGLSVQSIASNQVTLRWTPPSSVAATGYVLQGGIAPGQTLASVPTGSTATTFSFTAPTGIFYLRMVAQTAGGTSAPSNEVLAYINVPAPPATPTGLLGLASGSQLALSWRNSAGGGTPTSMQLDVSGALAASLPLPVGETFAFNGVPSGTYTFAVRAANTTGTSAASAPVTLTFPSACPGAPLAPANFQAARAGNQLALTWDPPASGPAISSYVLTVSGPLSAAIPLATRSIGGAVPPGTYTLTVRAVNACGQGAPSAAQTVTVP